MNLNQFKVLKNKRKISIVTAYDFPSAKICEEAGMDAVLVGDSLGMVIQGKNSTLEVTLEQMIYHCEMVSRGASQTLIIGDLPFGTFQISKEKVLENAFALMQKGKCTALKLEGATDFIIDVIKHLVSHGIPVIGHVGLTPQSVHQLGGYGKQAKDEKSAAMLVEETKKLEQAGVFSIVLENIPEELAKKITETLSIPTIGIGAGSYTDGQVSVWHDVLGLGEFKPPFAKSYLEGRKLMVEALKNYKTQTEK
jgi:3-methyl-2-oxobutanoate hydroxymethyltransferase